MRKPVYAICEQQRRRSACPSAQSDQRLCCSLSRQYNISSFYILNFKTLGSFCGCADRFVSYLVENPEDRFSCDEAQLKQVAQRATIAHLSPMCQGQISFQKTYKWAMETRGQKSNSSELLMPVKNERASMETPFSHYKYMGNFLDLKGS